MQTSIQVSIVIPVLNQIDKVQSCLDALLQQDFPRDQLEIIVVDNGSTDGTWNILEQYAVKRIQVLHFKSPYVCKNMGVKLARGQFLVFLDASLLPGKDWLNPGLNKLRSNPNAIIIGNTVSSFDSRHPTAYELLDSLYLSPLDLANESSGTPGGNVFLSMETWKLVGEFMEVRSLGDIEWSARALNSGIKLVPEKDAIVYYTPKMKTSFIKKAIRMGKGRKALILSQKKNAMPLLVLFMIRQFLPPNPFTLYSTIQARNRAEYKGRFFEMYLVAWHFKLSYLRGIFTSNAYNQSTDL